MCDLFFWFSGSLMEKGSCQQNINRVWVKREKTISEFIPELLSQTFFFSVPAEAIVNLTWYLLVHTLGSQYSKVKHERNLSHLSSSVLK